jgi:RsiW-degrading membrane proteinase PrsW (M82 family)
VLLASALVLIPTLIYAVFLWWLDRYEKEPIPLLMVAFVWGAVPAIVIAILLEVVVGIPLEQVVMVEQARQITEASLIAPIVEEGVKAVILVVLFVAYWREFDDLLDGVVYGAMVGLGFAMVENVIYLTSSAYEDLPQGAGPDIGRMVGLWVLRAGLFGLNHSMFTAFTGAALGLARSLKIRWQKALVPSVGLAVAMLFHGIHNALASAVGILSKSGDEANTGLVLGACLGIFLSDWGGLLLIIVLAIISSMREARVIQQTLWEEVALGRFTPDEYETLISGRKRWSVRWSVLFSRGFKRWKQMGRFFDLATELAFRKHRMNDGDLVHQTISARDVARLRGQIDHLKTQMIYGS